METGAKRALNRALRITMQDGGVLGTKVYLSRILVDLNHRRGVEYRIGVDVI